MCVCVCVSVCVCQIERKVHFEVQVNYSSHCLKLMGYEVTTGKGPAVKLPSHLTVNHGEGQEAVNVTEFVQDTCAGV